MGQVNISLLFRSLAEHQKLDPDIAGKLLKRILRVLMKKRKDGSVIRSEGREERVDEKQ